MALPIVPCKTVIALVAERTIPDNRRYNRKKLVSCVQNNTLATMGNLGLLPLDLCRKEYQYRLII